MCFYFYTVAYKRVWYLVKVRVCVCVCSRFFGINEDIISSLLIIGRLLIRVWRWWHRGDGRRRLLLLLVVDIRVEASRWRCWVVRVVGQLLLLLARIVGRLGGGGDHHGRGLRRLLLLLHGNVVLLDDHHLALRRLIEAADDIPGVNQPGNPAQQGQQDVQAKVPAAARHHHHRQRREQKRQDERTAAALMHLGGGGGFGIVGR